MFLVSRSCLVDSAKTSYLLSFLDQSGWSGWYSLGKGNHTELNEMKLFCCMFVNCHVTRLPAAWEKNSTRTDSYLLQLINHLKKMSRTNNYWSYWVNLICTVFVIPIEAKRDELRTSTLYANSMGTQCLQEPFWSYGHNCRILLSFLTDSPRIFSSNTVAHIYKGWW